MSLLVPVVLLGSTSRFQTQIYTGSARVEDLSALTRVVLKAGGVTVDTDTEPSAITWDEQDVFSKDVLTFQLGGQPIPRGLHGGRIELYAPTFTGGRSIVHDFPIEITGAA